MSVLLRETTLTILDSIETGSPVETEIVRVVSLSTTEITEITRFTPFPHNDTFRRVWKRSLLKTFLVKEKLLGQAFSPLSTMFSTLSKTEIIIFVTFNLSSENALYLVCSKILSFGNALNN